jgi:hypothetical protein
MLKNILILLILLIVYTILNKTSDKIIEKLTEESPLCPILKEEYQDKKCGALFGIGEHTDCAKIKAEAEKEGCQL